MATNRRFAAPRFIPLDQRFGTLRLKMKQINLFFTKKAGCLLWFCLLLIFHTPDVSVAMSLNHEEAKIRPRARLACYASSTIGTRFIDPESLGSHGYKHSRSEKNGIIYTRKAGHIDIAHLRKTADWTAFLAAKTLQQLMNNETEFSFKLREPSLYFVQITYPQYWQDLSRQQKVHIAYDISIRLGQYFAYTACGWHEILTWFGYKAAGFYPEFPSAFSWEDMFSNVLGTHIAFLAIWDSEHAFDEAVTLAIDRELKALQVQPKHIAIRAAKTVRGKWFSGDFLFVDLKKRNFDIGLDDGLVTPWIVPSVSGCDAAEAQSYSIPNLNSVFDYGFSVKLEIEPKEWEKDQILKIVYPDVKQKENRLQPAIHFAPIMKHIKQDAVTRYGPDVGSPWMNIE